MRSDRIRRLQSDCDSVIHAFTRLRNDLPELIRRCDHAARDGYPTSSLGGGNAVSGDNRPTESAAMSKSVPDPVRSNVRQMLTLLNDTARSAVSVGNLRTLVLGDGIGDSGALCGNCGRDVGIGRIRANRCSACFEYRRRTSVERPSELWKTK